MNTFTRSTRFRKPSEYRKLLRDMPEHSGDLLRGVLTRAIRSEVISMTQVRMILDLYTHINQGTRKKHEFYEFTSEHILKFFRYRINLMNNRAPDESENNIKVLRVIARTIHRIIELIYRENQDYQVNGVYVYRKRVPSRFIYNFREDASDTFGYMKDKEYQEILQTFLDGSRYLEALTFALLYKTGMERNEIVCLTSDLVDKEPNLDGSVTTNEVKDGSGNISIYDIGKEEIEIMNLWLEQRGFNHEKVMVTSDRFRSSKLTEHWVNVFWGLDVQSEFDIDYSFHYLRHDDNRTVLE